MAKRPDTSSSWQDDLPLLLRSLLLPTIAAAVGGLATGQSVKTWYPPLRKSALNPPPGIFGPVWTILYTLMAIADFQVQRSSAVPAEQRTQAHRIYRLQLILNTLWSVLFFGLRSPLAALVEMIVLWVAIALTIRSFARVSRVAAALMLPYLLWVSFAAFLNAEVWRLNRS